MYTIRDAAMTTSGHWLATAFFFLSLIWLGCKPYVLEKFLVFINRGKIGAPWRKQATFFSSSSFLVYFIALQPAISILCYGYVVRAAPNPCRGKSSNIKYINFYQLWTGVCTLVGDVNYTTALRKIWFCTNVSTTT